MRILNVTPQSIKEASIVIQKGGLVVFPTVDVYGRKYEIDFEMTEFVENKKIASKSTSARGSASGTKWKVSWTLKPTETGTQLTYAAD
ncbi:MAG: SRPBCC domain-containing protein [Actinomycetota bacterium]|nr:SRPBCC domain-containing protein [Actinomycetota bacterium]